MSKLKFNSADQGTLTANYENCAQFVAIIENHEGELHPSIVPTDMLYDICTTYLAMYDTLVEHSLLKAGYPTSKSHKLH
jgi:hypothetical protein